MMAAAAIIVGNTACNNAQQGKEMSMISADSLSAGSDINPTESEKDQDEPGNAQIIKIYNYLDNTDVKNEDKLLNSMRSVVNDHSEVITKKKRCICHYLNRNWHFVHILFL